MYTKWSDIGIYHIENHKKNEDALSFKSMENRVAIALCDGVSTCENAGQGAKIACESLCEFFANKGKKLISYDMATIAEKTIFHILFDLSKVAESEGKEIESFSSTAACALYDKSQKKLLCINVGDAMIGGIGKRGVEIIMKPQVGYGGCYVTTTKGIEKVTEIKVIDASNLDSVFICSDGLWKQLFINGKIIKKAEEYLKYADYDGLVSCMKNQKSFDDRSIIAMNINYEGKSAS